MIPVEDDNVAEKEEGFTCVLSFHSSQSSSLVQLDRNIASISILDNDGKYKLFIFM